VIAVGADIGFGAVQAGLVDGVVLLDKPSGMSSNAALQVVRSLFGRVKAGHTGTLDPLATGLLPVCLGDATKFAGGLLEADKVYDAIIRLGTATSTGDAEGEPVLRGSTEGCLERLAQTLASFVGDIDQLPPMFSALKHHGRPLYHYARAGQSVERQPRRVTIYALELVSTSGVDALVRVRCSKGTYVRSLAHEIGVRLSCGAHVVALRRVGIGRLKIEEAVGLDALAAFTEVERLSYLWPADVLVADLPAVVVDPARAEALVQGRTVEMAEAAALGRVRLYAQDGQFLGLGAGAGVGLLSPKRMCVRRRVRTALAGADLA
jgi:tRNA pseudouridine55 synthase